MKKSFSLFYLEGQLFTLAPCNLFSQTQSHRIGNLLELTLEIQKIEYRWCIGKRKKSLNAFSRRPSIKPWRNLFKGDTIKQYWSSNFLVPEWYHLLSCVLDDIFKANMCACLWAPMSVCLFVSLSACLFVSFSAFLGLKQNPRKFQMFKKNKNATKVLKKSPRQSVPNSWS